MWFTWLILCGVILLIPTAYAGIIGAPFVPTRQAVLKKTLETLVVDEDDVLVDLGAGSGTVLVAAVHRGARAVGYELSPIMWCIAKIRSLGYRNIRLMYGNFFRHALPIETTIIFLFLMPNTMPRLLEYLAKQQLPHVRHVVTYTFRIPDVPPKQVIEVAGIGKMYVYHLSDLQAAGQQLR